VQIRHRSFTQPVSAHLCDEEEYRESVQQEISKSGALLQEEHAILLLTATGDARTAEDKSPKRNGMNKSAKVVLGRADQSRAVMIPVRMLTKTARWLTLTNGFHPIQRAPGYDRSSLTGGTHSLLLAALIVVWLRRNVVLARLRVVGPHA
jgi:hypothetical protein